ncbi:MAG: hypothetical protein GX943_00095 [Candidatus Pacebacteria bacterium]|jgi:hypothetical protein|nr:hypothetical protein [Candidatus Paceibacterota bacterium]
MSKRTEKEISYQEFLSNLNLLVGLPLCHVDPYYQKVDFHFGSFVSNGEENSGDYVLYISGFWEILDSGKEVIIESDSEEKKKNFFDKKLLNSKIQSINVFKKPKEIFIEFENKKIIHCIEEENRWIEILKRNGDLLKSEKDKFYISKIIN